MFRSETMLHKKIRIPKHLAESVLNCIGQIEDGIEFINLNKNDLVAQKNFLSMIKRCDEIDLKINNLDSLCKRYKEKQQKYKNIDSFFKDLETDMRLKERSMAMSYFDTLEHEIMEDEKTGIQLMNNYTEIIDNLENCFEKQAVLLKVQNLLKIGSNKSGNTGNNNQIIKIESGNNSMSLEDGYGATPSSSMMIIAGVIAGEDLLRMKRMIFRVSKGRASPTFFEYNPEMIFNEDSISASKKIYVVFFQETLEGVLLQKIIKVCDIFNASRFSIPPREQFQGAFKDLQTEIAEKQNLLNKVKMSSISFIKNKVGNSAEASKFEFYKQYFKKEKYIYSNLNKCKVRDNFIDGEVFIPESKYDKVLEAIKKMSQNVDENQPTVNLLNPSSSNTNITYPTYIKSNEFTWAFQEIVNTYGNPRYKEINPAIFNIATFPFLFGVMYGDIAHGLIVFILGLVLIINADSIKKNKNSLLRPMLKARYIVMFMGFCALYCGLLYNDFASFPLPLGKKLL